MLNALLVVFGSNVDEATCPDALIAIWTLGTLNVTAMFGARPSGICTGWYAQVTTPLAWLHTQSVPAAFTNSVLAGMLIVTDGLVAGELPLFVMRN